MSFMGDFYKRFVREEYDENGFVTKFDLDLKYDYNFAYDVIDEIAKHEPERVAIHWVSENGEEKIFTYKERSFHLRATVWQICSQLTVLKRAT